MWDNEYIYEDDDARFVEEEDFQEEVYCEDCGESTFSQETVCENCKYEARRNY